MFKKKGNRLFVPVFFLIFALSLSATVVRSDAYNNEDKIEKGCRGVPIEMYVPEDAEFEDEEEVIYYAYMNVETAEESIKMKILQARNIIISNSSWTADGVKGCEENEEDGTVRELPQFSEMFPSDWEMPILSTGEQTE